MDFSLPFLKTDIKDQNIVKYKGIPPPWDLIRDVVKKSKLKHLAKFEKVWGIPARGLTKYKNGHVDLSPLYWHIFYDYESVSNVVKERVKTKRETKKVEVISTVLNSNQKLLDELRRKF